MSEVLGRTRAGPDPRRSTARRVSELEQHDPMTEQQTDPDDEYRHHFNERELQREIEGAAEQLERNTRTLADVFVEHMERSDELEIRIALRGRESRRAGYIP